MLLPNNSRKLMATPASLDRAAASELGKSLNMASLIADHLPAIDCR
jgi:hypothetical protein